MDSKWFAIMVVGLALAGAMTAFAVNWAPKSDCPVVQQKD